MNAELITMNSLLSIDTQLFLFFNHLPHNAILNAIGLGISGAGSLGIIWYILGILFFFKEEKRDHWFFAPLLLVGIGTLVIADGILKPLIARTRPGLEIGAIILGGASHDYSFPSGHATMSFAAAFVLSRGMPRWKWVFYVLAVLISFSRMYVGKHYPLDVIGGALLGWGIGFLSIIITSKLKLLRKK